MRAAFYFHYTIVSEEQYKDRNKERKLDHAMKTARTNSSRIPSCCGKFSLGNYFRETYFKTSSVSIQQLFSFLPAHCKIFKLRPFFKQFCCGWHNNKKHKIQQDVLPTDVKENFCLKVPRIWSVATSETPTSVKKERVRIYSKNFHSPSNKW